MPRSALKLTVLLVIAFAIYSSSAYCQIEDNLFVTARIKGRGNTYVAQFFGDGSTRFNPALLAETNSTLHLRPFEANVVVSDHVVKTASDLLDFDFSSSDSDLYIDLIKKFGDKFGDRHEVRGDFQMLATRLWQLEFIPFATNRTFVEIRRPSIPKFDYSLDFIAGLHIGYGHEIDGKWKLGGAIKPFYRATSTGELTFTDILDLENTSVDELTSTADGQGMAADVSALWTPTVNFRLSAIIHNLGGALYFGSDDNPDPLPQQSSLGLLYRKPINRWDLNFLADLQGLENADGKHWSSLLHFGTEFGTRAFTKDLDFGLTAGLSEGYGSFGFFADIWIVKIEYAKYTVELDRLPGRRPDKRQAFSLRTSLTF